MFILLLLLFNFCYSFNLNMLSEKPPPMWTALSKQFKNNARQWFIKRAEDEGIQWNDMVSDANKYMNILETIKHMFTNDTMIYPEYYTQPFHGYDTGNLNWLSSLECEPATLSMAVRYWKNTTPIITQNWLRRNISNHIKNYIGDNVITSYNYNILDVGCSIGISTEYLRETFDKSNIYGIDLSPYFLSMAILRSKIGEFDISYSHQNAEYTNFDNNNFNLVVCSFIMHELPETATKNILNEIYRILSPGSVIAIVDLTPVLLKKNFFSRFTQWSFEVTEPHIYDYYNRDMKKLLRDTDFVNIKSIKNDPLNTVWLATKPRYEYSYAYSHTFYNEVEDFVFNYPTVL